eukprot:gene7895-7962_t
MKISIHKNYDDTSRAAADLVIAQVKSKPQSLICFPSGDSPAGMLKLLVTDANNGLVDFSECFFVGLDEWVGMDKDDDGSCTNFLLHTFFLPAGIDPARIRFFDAKADDLGAACAAMDHFIKDHGPLDIMVVGIGMNGHIGLNEPGTDFNLFAHHAPLAPVTIEHLKQAGIPVLIASGIKKAGIIAQALDGPVTEQVPGSIFQTLSSSVIFLDDDAASGLST